MSRTPQTLASGTKSTTTTEAIYDVPVGNVATPYLSITNNSTTKVDVSVYINNTTSDLLFRTKTLPAGVGKEIFFTELANHKLNPLYELKIALSAAVSVNYFLSGSLIAAS